MSLARVSSRLTLSAAVASVLIPLSLAQDKSDTGEDFDTGVDRTSQLIVMLTGELGAAPTFGAGILFGRDHDRLYIVTANHVVRRGTVEATNIRVTFKFMPDKPLAAKLLGQADRESDVAVVALEGWARQGVDGCKLPFDRLGDPGTLHRGNTVYAIGNPNGENWRLPSSDRLYTIGADQLAFQSAFIAVGSSGGALMNQDTRIVGMVRRDEPPAGSAIPMSVVLPLVSKWGLPVQLRVAQPDGSTPLHAAAVAGDIDGIKAELVAACADPEVGDGQGNTPLQRATDAGQLEAVKLLIRGSANVKANSARGKFTALHVAAARHNQQIATLLLNAGADVNARDALGATALLDVRPQKTDASEVAQAKAGFVRFLIQAGADVNARPKHGDGLLHQALTAGNREILAALLEAHADVNLKGWNKLPLEIAVDSGDMDTIKLLLRAGADVNAGGAFLEALLRKNGPLVALLLSSGARVSTAGNIDVLQEAIRQDWIEVLKLLLAAGIDINRLHNDQTVNEHTVGGSYLVQSPLEIAVEVKNREIVKLLIADRADVNLADQERKTALHQAACVDGDVFVKLLLDAGARVNASDSYGSTPLHAAVGCKNEEAAKLLLQAGASINVKDHMQNTPLMLAKGTPLEGLLRSHSGR